jgi:hypothetical protein
VVRISAICAVGSKFTTLNEVDNKLIFIFVTQTKAGKHNSIFALNSNMLLVLFFHEARILNDLQLKFDENLYLLYITDSIYVYIT